MQFGSRGRRDGIVGETGAGAIWVAAIARALFGLGLTDLETAEAVFCVLTLGWYKGARGCVPTLVLDEAAGPLVTRRGEELVTVFMFLSSFCKAAMLDFGPFLVRLVVSKRRDFGG